LFCEALDYNILFRWFLDMNLEEASLDQSNFSRLRERLVEHDMARSFFDSAVKRARDQQLLSDEHFTVDGTLIEAWASLKSFRRKDGADNDPGADGMVAFKGGKRPNATHASTSDCDAKLMRKGLGKEAKLSYGEHVLMENGHGLCVDVIITAATAKETDAACAMLERQRRKGLRPATVGVQRHQQRCLQQPLRWDRRASGLGIHLLTLPTKATQQLVRVCLDRAQRMLRRYTRLWREITKHPCLRLPRVHACLLPWYL
jgi:hypothetical protein